MNSVNYTKGLIKLKLMKISIHHIVTQKVGNSVGFSLPASFKVEVGTEYTIHQKSDGSLILIPKISNPYTSDAKFEDVPGPEREAWENLAMEELRHAED